jgi:uncharacterized membrane protein
MTTIRRALPPVPTGSHRVPRGGLLLLGFALGGFIDGILLHQVLQWHHLLSAVDGGTIPLAVQITADGLFHLLMYALALVGLWMTWRGRAALAQGAGGRTVASTALVGFFLWHLVDATVFHGVLRLHRIRMDTSHPLAWDVGWFALFGLVPLAIAWALRRSIGTGGGPGQPRRSKGPRAGSVLGVAALLAGGWAAVPSGEPDQLLVVFRPGIHAAQASAALGRVDGRIVWVDRDGLVWSVRTSDRAAALRLYGQGALLVSRSPLGLGCVSWLR